MRRLWLVPIFSLAGCAGDAPAPPQLHSAVETYPRVSLTQQQIQLVYAGVQRVLSDPNSARFSDINAGRKPDGTLYVCGSVDTGRHGQLYRQSAVRRHIGRARVHADHHRWIAGAAAFDPRAIARSSSRSTSLLVQISVPSGGRDGA